MCGGLHNDLVQNGFAYLRPIQLARPHRGSARQPGDVMKALPFVALAILVLACAPARAGGDVYGSGPYCRDFRQADELVSYDYSRKRELIAAVEWRYQEAAEVSKMGSTIYRTGGVANGISPLYLWANEAKTSCAKALGYLKKWHHLFGREFNVEMLQKCECFYERMVHYQGRR